MHKTGLTPEQIFAASDNLAYLQWNDDGCFCLRTQASENNLPRVIQITDSGEATPVSPKGLAVRTRVHEYGGRPYLVSHNTLFFCRDDTQQIMQINLPLHHNGTTTDAQAIAVTPDAGQNRLRYADFDHDLNRQRLLAIREDHRGQTILNTLVTIPLPNSDSENGTSSTAPHEGQPLFTASDFIASPRLSPDGKFIAFISWSHPNMPWDNTELRIIALNSDGDAGTHFTLTGLSEGAVQQLQFDEQGRLWFLSDFEGWWQLYVLPSLHEKLTTESATLDISDAQRVFTPHRDCASPPWIVGQQQFAITTNGQAVTASIHESLWQVHTSAINNTEDTTIIANDLSLVESIASHKGRIRMIAGTTAQAGGLLEYQQGAWRPLIQPQLLPDVVTLKPIAPIHISYPTGADATAANSDNVSSGSASSSKANSGNASLSATSTEQGRGTAQQHRETAYGLFYRPINYQTGNYQTGNYQPSNYQPGDTQSAPPLIVTVHGGPSSSAKAGLNPMTQYWLQQGFAILDVDHRGSTGYGRNFRKRLYGDWGKIDIEDIIAAVQYVTAQQWINPEAVFIRGGSAGGYAVLASLCQSDLFKGGACYYGISDMTILAADTHKFESHYVEQLIGPLPEFADRYQERSPINHINDIQAPVLFLHGMQDKVVPPEQASMIFQALQPRIPECQLVTFPDEAHGFRKTANQIKALESEVSFYRHILSSQK